MSPTNDFSGSSSSKNKAFDDPGFTDLQMQQLVEQELLVGERENEIRSIVESVNDLSEVHPNANRQ